MNTVLVAILGCITATVVGGLVGILRLSRNWLVSRIMTVYVEGFRNVPVLLWIILVMAIMIESMPAPRDFRGEDPAASLQIFDSVAITNRGVYIPEPLFSRGLGDIDVLGAFEVSLDLVAFLVVLGVGLWASDRVRRRADRMQNETGVRPVVWWQRTCLVVIPSVVLLYLLGFHLGLPELKGFNFKGGPSTCGIR